MSNSSLAFAFDPPSPPLVVTAAKAMASQFAASRTISRSDINRIMTDHFGATDALGAWSVRDAHAALELAQVQHLQASDQIQLTSPVDEAEQFFCGLDARVPTQNNRSDEQIEWQQFATPLHFAWLAARACALAGALELGTRHLAQGLARGEALTEPGRAGEYLARRLRALPYEVFACLFLDTRHRVIAFEELFRGTLDGAEVHPREVVQRCLAHHAAAVILGHNHPSGCTEPSAADRAVTARLKQALALVEVRVLDHFIIGDGAPCSMARLGAL